MVTIVTRAGKGSPLTFDEVDDNFTNLNDGKLETAGGTLTGPVTITSGTQTVSTPALDMTQTWNNAATTFTGYKLNVTDTASNASSLLMDLQVGGSSRFNVRKNGRAFSNQFFIDTFWDTGMGGNFTEIFFYRQGTPEFIIGTRNVKVGTDGLYGFTSGSLGISSIDLVLTRKAAASLRLGAADAAAPVAQTLGVQSVVAGTSNTPGQNFTIAGSQGTGTGAGGSIVFQTAAAGSSGTLQNALLPVATIGPNALTGSQAIPVLDIAQTWNTSGTPTAMKLNVTDTASNASSLLMDLQVGGNSKFGIVKDGSFYSGQPFSGNATINWSLRFSGVAGTTGFASQYNLLKLFYGGSELIAFGNNITYYNANLTQTASAYIGFNEDVFFTRKAAANIRLGRADAASPIAQTLSVQSVVAGTSNTAGSNFTIAGSQGTGTGAGGSIVFQVAPAGASGTAQNALATALTIDGTRTATFAGNVFASDLRCDYLRANSFVQIGGTSGGYISGPANDTFRFNSIAGLTVNLTVEANNTLAQRNGVNAQAFRLYNTYTDASNYERLNTSWQSNTLVIQPVAAGTGTVRELAIGGGSGATSGFTFKNSLAINWRGLVFNNGTFNSSSSFQCGFYAEDNNVLRIHGTSQGLGAAVYMIEMTAPAAPAANGVRIYAEDDGAGKTRLMALFATGAAQQIAIEP